MIHLTMLEAAQAASIEQTQRFVAMPGCSACGCSVVRTTHNSPNTAHLSQTDCGNGRCCSPRAPPAAAALLLPLSVLSPEASLLLLLLLHDVLQMLRTSLNASKLLFSRAWTRPCELLLSLLLLLLTVVCP